MRFGYLMAGVLALSLAAAPLTVSAETATYSYDTRGRLVGVTYTGGVTVTYSYDAAGNRTQKTLTGGATAPNTPPTANADTATTSKNVAVTFNVLANDGDADGDTLTITAVGAPTAGSGTATYSGANVTFTPATNWTGTSTFTYTISDGHGGAATGNISVTVNALTLTAKNPSYNVTFNSTSTVNASMLATASDGGAMTITAASVAGDAGETVTVNAGGVSITYKAPNLSDNCPTMARDVPYTARHSSGAVVTGHLTMNAGPVSTPTNPSFCEL